MTNLGLLGTEKSSNELTNFVGTEHLYDLGMIYKGCKDDNLSVLHVPCDEDMLKVFCNTIAAIILGDRTAGSKVQILFNPAEIELAFIKLALKSKAVRTTTESNVIIEDDVPYDINNAESVTLLCALTESREEVINKLIAQANDGNSQIFIVTNNKEVFNAFIDFGEEEEGNSTASEEKTFTLPAELDAAFSTGDFSSVPASVALSCKDFFDKITHNGKEYIILHIDDSDKGKELALAFTESAEGKLALTKDIKDAELKDIVNGL